jgi:hypothetical protein
MFHRIIRFHHKGFLAPCHNTQAGEPPFVSCPQLLIQCTRRYSPYLTAFPSTTTWRRSMLWRQEHNHHCFFRFRSYKMCNPQHINVKLFRGGNRDWVPTTGIKDILKSVKTAIFWGVMPHTQLVLQWPKSITSHKTAVFASLPVRTTKLKLKTDGRSTKTLFVQQLRVIT